MHLLHYIFVNVAPHFLARAAEAAAVPMDQFKVVISGDEVGGQGNKRKKTPLTSLLQGSRQFVLLICI